MITHTSDTTSSKPIVAYYDNSTRGFWLLDGDPFRRIRRGELMDRLEAAGFSRKCERRQSLSPCQLENCD